MKKTIILFTLILSGAQLLGMKVTNRQEAVNTSKNNMSYSKEKNRFVSIPHCVEKAFQEARNRINNSEFIAPTSYAKSTEDYYGTNIPLVDPLPSIQDKFMKIIERVTTDSSKQNKIELYEFATNLPYTGFSEQALALRNKTLLQLLSLLEENDPRVIGICKQLPENCHAIEQLCKLAPAQANPESVCDLAYTFYKKNQIPEAIKYSQIAVELGSQDAKNLFEGLINAVNNPTDINKLGLDSLLSGKFLEAHQYFEQAEKLGSEEAIANLKATCHLCYVPIVTKVLGSRKDFGSAVNFCTQECKQKSLQQIEKKPKKKK